jgi:hypothetical protein
VWNLGVAGQSTASLRGGKDDELGAEPNSAAMKVDSAPAERSERKAVSLRAFIVREDGSSFDVQVLDLSYEGCGIEADVALSPNEAVKLSVLRRGAIDCRVRWSGDGKAGLAFEPETPARPELPRVTNRVPLSADVSLRRVGQNNYGVRVTDLSPQGCKVQLVEVPRLKDRMMVKFEGLEVLEAEVCWVEGFTAGLRFERPFHPAVFALLVERLNRASS